MRGPRYLGKRLEAHAHVDVWAAPIDDRRGANDLSPLVTRHVDRLSGRLAGRHDVLDDQDPFAGVESEPASQHQTTVATLCEHRTYAERARHLVSDDQAAKSG